MPKWEFEPGHTQAEFRARHMMVTWVTGLYKNIQGEMEFDPAQPEKASVEMRMPAGSLWTGVGQRDDHLRSSDFLDAEKFPAIEFRSTGVAVMGENEYKVSGELTIRGTTRPATLDVRYLGKWQTPYWEDGVDKGPKTRIGFTATTKINRHDFGVNWNDFMDKGGVVVGDDVHIKLDVEALLKD